jgi:serine/threonine-protein kinase
MINQTLLHYQIVEELGSGGMGVVYKARDLKLERFVALKFLPAHLGADPHARQRFIQEAKAASALDHPNICTIHEIEESSEGQTFIVMAYCEGETLSDKIERGLLEIATAVDIAIQIAQGLAKAHASGIIHRDIKPANIIISPEGIVKIVDFGLAKLAGNVRLTSTGTTLGTAAYVSPEQLRGEKVDQRADIWSLGVVSYEMLTGRLPFLGEYPEAMFYTILNENPPPVVSLRPKIPMRLVECVEKTLRKKQAERYQRMDELVHDLLFIQSSLPPASREKLSPLNIPAREKAISRKSLSIIAVILLILAIFWGYFKLGDRQVAPSRTTANRIAVLPFKNISPNEQDAYFADGMTEELISNISNIWDLKVIALTSVMQYKKFNRSISQIGAELNVGTVVRGSVRKAGNQLRITVHLIDVANEENLWSHSYDREFKDVFTIQSDIARSVAKALKIRLKKNEKERIEQPATRNLAAYENYLKGRYYLNKRTPPAISKGLDYFSRAIEEDSALALAYTGLADAYSILGSTEYCIMPARVARPRAKTAALKAIQLDENLAEAFTSLANIQLFYEYDRESAEKNFRRAIELNPNYATARHWYSLYFMSSGKFEEALAEIRKAQEIDPISPIINMDVGSILQYARRYDESIRQVQEVLELDEHFVIAYVVLAFNYDLKDMHKEAIATIQKAREIAGDFPMILAAVGYVLGKAGEKESAEEILQELLELSTREDVYLSPLYIALVYTGLGNIDNAVDWVEKAYEDRSSYLVYMNVDPKAAPLRASPRFTRIMEKMGFTN